MLIRIIGIQLKKAVLKKEFKFAFTAMLIIVFFAYLESCLHVFSCDVTQLYSAAYGWVGHCCEMQIQVMNAFYFFFIFLIGSSVYSDNLMLEKKSKIHHCILTRIPNREYVTANGVTAFLMAFFVILVPLMISQLLAFIVLPINSKIMESASIPPVFMNIRSQYVLFPSLYFNHPYLLNLLFVFYDAFSAGVFALLAFAFSLFIQKSRLIIIGVPMIIVLLQGATFSSNYSYFNYLYPSFTIEGRSEMLFFAFPIIVLAISITMICVNIKFKKDVSL